MRRSRADAERPVDAVVVAGQRVVAFGALEIGQDVAKRPAGTALLLGPGIVVLRAAAGEDLGVDRTAAAQHACLCIDHGASADRAAGRGLVAPNQRPRLHLEEAGRQMDEAVAVGRAGLDQRDRHAGILAQPGGQNAAGRARADDHIVGHRSSQKLDPVTPQPTFRGHILNSLVRRQEKGYGYGVEGLSYKFEEICRALERRVRRRKMAPAGRKTSIQWEVPA